MTAGAPVLTVAAMRAAERSSGVPLDELMERAGRAVAQQARRFAAGRPVLVLCGPGDNGGDGYVAARMLTEWGHAVTVARSGEPASDLARGAAERWTGATVPLSEAEASPLVVDALFGVGLSRPLREEIAAPVRRLVEAAEIALAVDLPSGLMADEATGDARSVTATLALGALKPAHLLMPGMARCGTVLLDPLGLEPRSAAHRLVRPRLSAPATDAQKFTRGLVAVIGGPMHGAGRLSARAALSAGAGYVRLHPPGPVFPEPDALVVTVTRADAVAGALADDRIGAAVIGPGLGRDMVAKARLDATLSSGRPLVIDGDALSLLGTSVVDRLRGRSAPAILTPHSGEFARLTGGDDRDALTAARALASASGAVVVHKGAATVIATPDGRARIGSGTSWLSTAGTGDVLSGTVAARLAVGGDPFEGAAEAVWLHARAATLAGPAFHADDLVRHLPAALAECL